MLQGLWNTSFALWMLYCTETSTNFMTATVCAMGRALYQLCCFCFLSADAK